ncbi:MAG: RrF2 family transcriptional regulator [Candidatus Methylomirabilales bacterium]
MHLSRESEYGLKAMIYLAQEPPETVLTLSQIAEARDLPVGFLAKIFQKLARHGLLQSFRGRQRGYSLTRDASKIKLREVLEAIEGRDLFQRCLLWGHRSGDKNPCLVHRECTQIRTQLLEALEQKTLADLAQENGGDYGDRDHQKAVPEAS